MCLRPGEVVRLRASLVRRLQGSEGSSAAGHQREAPRRRTLPQEPRHGVWAPLGQHPRSAGRSAARDYCVARWPDPLDLQPADRPTLAQVLASYLKRPNAAANDALQEKKIISTVVQGRPFGDWCAAEITREAIDAFRAQRPRVAGNRNLALLRALFNWGVAGGLLPGTPFRVGHVPVVKLAREEARPDACRPVKRNGCCSRPTAWHRSSWRRSRRAAGAASSCRCNGRRSGRICCCRR